MCCAVKNKKTERSIPMVCTLFWNVLAQTLAKEFPKVDSSLLSWEHRSEWLKKLIKENRKNIINLVEVDKFNELAKLIGSNYEGILNMRTDNLMGCCMFYDKRVLTVKHT